MNHLIYATTIEHALSIWNALALDIDLNAVLGGEQQTPLSAGFLDLSLVGAVALRDENAYQIVDGVPVVRHEGGMSKYPSLGRMIGITKRTRSYAEIAETLHEAARDRRAQTPPLLVLDTSGGGVDGHAELVRAVQETEAEIFAERATSAGTWLAAAASRVTVATSGAMGSVGVICIPLDVSARLEREGLKPVPIVSDGAEIKAIGGDGKIDEKVIAKIKPRLNAMAQQFQRAVREGRSLTGEQAEQVFTADVWIGAENVRLGLADAVASDARQVISTMTQEAASRRRSTTTVTSTGDSKMNEDETPQVGETDLAARIQQLEADAQAREAALQAREAELIAEREARETAMAQLQAAETQRSVDRLMAQCADAPPCLTEGRDLAGFLTAAIDGGWTVNAEDGTKISAAEFVVGVVSAASGLAQLGGEPLADEEAPEESLRQESFEEAQADPNDPDPEAKDEDLDAALDEAWKTRGGAA